MQKLILMQLDRKEKHLNLEEEGNTFSLDCGLNLSLVVVEEQVCVCVKMPITVTNHTIRKCQRILNRFLVLSADLVR